MATKAQIREREDACEQLRAILKPGDTVYIIIRHVSRSGMMRAIDAYVIQENEPRWISRLAARAMDHKYNDKYQAVDMQGGGMDMGFALVYDLSQSLFPNGFGCIGEGCPSNDHSNGDRDYTKHSLGFAQAKNAESAGLVGHSHWHQDGGYALKRRWM